MTNICDTRVSCDELAWWYLLWRWTDRQRQLHDFRWRGNMLTNTIFVCNTICIYAFVYVYVCMCMDLYMCMRMYMHMTNKQKIWRTRRMFSYIVMEWLFQNFRNWSLRSKNRSLRSKNWSLNSVGPQLMSEDIAYVKSSLTGWQSTLLDHNLA